MNLELLQNKMKEFELSTIFIDNPKYVDYFTGYYTEPHERIVSLIAFQDKAYLFVPAIEKGEAKNSTNLPVISYKDDENPWTVIKDSILSKNELPLKLGIEDHSLIVHRYFELKKILPQTEFVNINSIIQKMMIIKNDTEITKMNEAGRLADQALSIGIDSLDQGVTEQEVVAVIEYHMKKMGVDRMSFSTLVLFGDHAASPHGVPGDRKLRKGELVLFDLGVEKNGYTSDVTRTISFGKVSDEIKTIYNIVLKAQLEAQNFVKAGVTASELDQIARNIIEEAGYGKYFNHRLGHGLGKDVHEYPIISSDNDRVIEKGMCFSIEPGIYIPGKVGIRIEDCVYVSSEGSLPFTQTDKNFTEIRPS